MQSEWQFVRLGDFCQKIGSGATPTGGKESYLPSGPFTLIRSQNVHNDRFSYDGLAYISDEQARKLDNVAVEPNDVLLNITGDSVARVCMVANEVLPARVNQHVAIIRPNEKQLDSFFLRYFLVSPEQQARMLSFASSGATRNALTKSMVENFHVPLPSLPEQKAIARVLASLDDKIELNRRMNATLEQMAQTLFRAWFVDFEPVKAKAAGLQPVGMNAETAVLFPSEFESSTLGPIPKGWKVESLDKIANFLNGLALQKYRPEDDEESLPVIKIAQLRKGCTDGNEVASTRIDSAYTVENGDVLFSWSGSLEVVVWCGGRGALNQHLFKVSSEVFPKWFYYFWTLHHLESFRRTAADKATTMGHIQRRHLTEAKVVIPPPMQFEKIGESIAPLLERQISNQLESQTLSQIRDALLPRLISGQLRVPEAMREVENVL